MDLVKQASNLEGCIVQAIYQARSERDNIRYLRLVALLHRAERRYLRRRNRVFLVVA